MFENINYEFSKTCSVFLDTELYILGGWCSKRTEAVNVVGLIKLLLIDRKLIYFCFNLTIRYENSIILPMK